MNACAIGYCDRPSYARGWCQPHYGRWHHTGKPQGRTPRDRFLKRLWGNIDFDAPGGCWQWTGSINHNGYGQITVGMYGRHKTFLAHRAVYQQIVGPIRSETLDHLCRNRACVNPSHLEPVTQRVNLLRGMSPAAQAARRDCCPRGHPYLPNNLLRGEKYRKCKRCHREREAARRERLRAERSGAEVAA